MKKERLEHLVNLRNQLPKTFEDITIRQFKFIENKIKEDSDVKDVIRIAGDILQIDIGEYSLTEVMFIVDDFHKALLISTPSRRDKKGFYFKDFVLIDLDKVSVDSFIYLTNINKAIIESKSLSELLTEDVLHVLLTKFMVNKLTGEPYHINKEDIMDMPYMMINELFFCVLISLEKFINKSVTAQARKMVKMRLKKLISIK